MCRLRRIFDIRQMAASISQKIGILRKYYRTLGRSEAINKSFLPMFYLALSRLRPILT